jgi:hypothetical protein
MINRITRKTAFVLVPLALASAPFTEWRFPVSILMGGAIGAVNIKGLAWSVDAVLGTDKAQAKMTVLGIFRFMILSLVLVALAGLNMLNIWGLFIGLTAVLVITVREGLLASRKEDSNSQF